MCVKLKKQSYSNTNSQESLFIDIEGYIIPKNNIQYIRRRSNYIGSRQLPPTYILYFGEPMFSFNKNAGVYNSHSADGAYESSYNHIELTEKQYSRVMSAIATQIIVI